MATLKYPNRVPPGGWFYVQPDTGFSQRHGTLVGLVLIIVEHRKANNLEGADYKSVRADIENQICERLRGKRSLWTFCEGLKIKEPPPGGGYAMLPVSGVRAVQAVAPSPVPRVTAFSADTGTTSTTAPAPAKKRSCPTCGRRKSST